MDYRSRKGYEVRAACRLSIILGRKKATSTLTSMRRMGLGYGRRWTRIGSVRRRRTSECAESEV